MEARSLTLSRPPSLRLVSDRLSNPVPDTSSERRGNPGVFNCFRYTAFVLLQYHAFVCPPARIYTADLGAIGLANSSGRFGWAAASDLIGRRATYALFGAAVPVMAGAPFLAHYAATSATAGATAATASAASGAALPLYAFCGGSLLAITFYGGTFSVLPAYIADLWGQKHSAAIHGKATLPFVRG